LSRYLYNAAYYWEVVVDGRSPCEGYQIYLEERRTGARTPVGAARSEKDMLSICRRLQQDLMLSEEEFEAKHKVSLSGADQPEESPSPPSPAQS
jgi:hypothetical protein